VNSTPAPPTTSSSTIQLVVLLVGGLAMVAGGVVLELLGQHEVGLVLLGMGAAELGVKGATLGR
jgi:hypothetical protein